MSSRSAAHPSADVPRRLVTTTAAWAVPAVTAAATAPALAASTAQMVDLALEGQPFGDGVSALSPDKLQKYDLVIVGGFDLTNMSDVDAPAGTTVTLSFDSRVFTGATLTADEVDVPADGGARRAAAGDITAIDFTLPTPIAAGAVVSLRPRLDRVNPTPWAEDIEPYTVQVTPASGTSDPVTANNSVSMKARYTTTSDAALTVTWREHNLVTSSGEDLPIQVPDTLTITANAPGDVPTDSSVTVGGPTVYDGSDYVDVFEDVSIASATLDGRDVADVFEKQPSSGIDDRVDFRIGTAIPAGQELVVKLDIDVATSTREFVYSGAWTEFYSSNDRDNDNNRADAPPFPNS